RTVGRPCPPGRRAARRRGTSGRRRGRGRTPSGWRCGTGRRPGSPRPRPPAGAVRRSPSRRGSLSPSPFGYPDWAWSKDGNSPTMTRLRRADPSLPGFTRRRAGKGFVYLDEHGERIVDTEVLARIKALVILPAWETVWICPWPTGHLQAVGIDARGRRQYRYHDRWRARRDAEKFDHMVEFARALPELRARCCELLAGDGLSRERVLACAIRLLD